MVELLLWTVACWVVFLVACLYLRDTLGARWKRVVALAVIPALAIGLVLVFLVPPIGGYNPMAARFWISRAAAEPDAAEKAALVSRVAMASNEHGWFAASQAIDSIGDATQRCRLRTILATLPDVRQKEKLGNQARDECNAAINKGSG